MQDKVQRATNALSAHSNHLCLAPGSTSCSLGWALVPALQTQSCQWVFKGLQCCSEEPLSLSVLPLTLGVQVASFPQGGLTSTVAGASRIRLSPMCLSLHCRLSGAYTRQIQGQELESWLFMQFFNCSPRMSINDKQGTSHRKWDLFISINVLGFYSGQQEGPAHLSNGQGRTAGAGPHD